MKPIVLPLLVCIVAALSGCADMGSARPQSAQLDANALQAGSAIAADDAHGAWPSEQWWQVYRDPQLDRLIETALRDNPGLREAAARARQAEAMAGVGQAATRPHVEAGMSLQRELFSEHDFIPAPEAGNYAWYNRVALEAGYDLDLWGRQRSTLAAMLAEKKVADAEAQLARLTLEQAVVRSYIALSLEHALKDLADDRLTHRRQAVQIMQKRLAAGLASEVEATQLDATLPTLQLEIEAHEERIAILRNQLAALAGKGPGSGESIARPALRLDDADALALPARLPADLIGRRPDVAASRWSVEAAAKEIDAARAAFYPDINLMAFIGFQSIGFTKFLSGESSVRGLGPAISLPIFDGGALRSKLGARTAAYDVAVERYNGTLVHALESVASRLAVARSVEQQLHLNERALATATRARALAQQGVKAGMTDYLILIDSEVNLLSRQQDQARLLAHRLESHAELMLALGGGLPSADAPALDKQAHSSDQSILLGKVQTP